MEKVCNIKIKLAPKESRDFLIVGENVSGEVEVVVEEEIVIRHLELRWLIESRGKIGTAEELIGQQFFLQRSTLVANKVYHFPFDFPFKGMENYLGTSVSFLNKLEVLVEESTTQKKSTSTFSFMDIFRWKKVYKENLYLNIKHLKPALSPAKETELELSDSQLFKTILIIIGLGFFLFLALQDKAFVFFCTAAIIAIIVLFFKRQITKTIGAIHYKTTVDSEGKIQQKISNNKNWKTVRKISYRYEVYEEVIDDRGTATQSYEKRIHQSQLQVFSRPHGDLSVQCDFPKHLPRTIHFAKARIYWLAQVEVTSFSGITFFYQNEFTVSKKEQSI